MGQNRHAKRIEVGSRLGSAAIIIAICCVFSSSSIASEDMPSDVVEISRGTPESHESPITVPLTVGEGCPDVALSQAERNNADTLIRSIGTLRALPVNEPVVSCIMPREQLREQFLVLFERDSDLEQLRVEGELLKLLGFIDEKVEILELILSLLEDEVVGFYDPVGQRLYVVPSESEMYDQMTLAHELVHALQDQSFDLESLMDPSLLISDPASARSALIEGDAIVAGLAVASGLQDMSELRPALLRRMAHSMWQAALTDGSKSAYLMRALVAPYASGTAFVASLLEGGGWDAVDSAFLRPPVSTEQVLHPEHYSIRDQPTWLEFASLRSVCEERVYVDIRGEFDMRNTLAELLGEDILSETVVSATTGWDGDRLEIWDDCFGDADIVVQASVWDTEDDADEYFAAATEAFVRWIGAGDESPSTSDTVAQHVVAPSGLAARAYAFDGSRAFVLERWGDQVVLGFVDGTVPVRPEQLTGLISRVSETLARFSYPRAVNDPRATSR